MTMRSIRRPLIAGALAAAAALSLTSVASAAIISGTPGHDVLNGTLGADAIFGLDGNDSIYGRAGSDQLHGQRGNDIVFGDYGLGPAGNDRLGGGPGADYLNGMRGSDTVRAGPDSDRIWSRSDNLTRDHLNCGSGYDIVNRDANDRFVDDAGALVTSIAAGCEVVYTAP